ncbi:FecR family protein [Niabella hirudinis]|uniref:FecR family protein n=1 Tax=Niabella hirudinis TaxID=1285929 RepID=UPI003EB92147
MESHPDPEKINDFLANNSNYTDAEAVFEYLESNETALDRVQLTEDLLPEELIETPYVIKRKVLGRIPGIKTMKMSLVARWMAAACIIGILGLGAVFLINGKKTVPGAAAITGKTVKNYTAAILNYTLPDSSGIVLQPGAAIYYQSDFAVNRVLNVMNGAVYFRVKKDGAHPFRVIANGINTTATGTEFWVQRFPDNKIDISLTHGRVYVFSMEAGFKMDTVFLMPGQTCTVDKNTGGVHVLTVAQRPAGKAKPLSAPQKDSPATIVWTNTEIQLSDASLQNVFAKLESRYNIKIMVADSSIYNATITGKIFYNDSLRVLIQAICEINQLSYEKSNDTIFLRR